jgi:hypothetical protein
MSQPLRGRTRIAVMAAVLVTAAVPVSVGGLGPVGAVAGRSSSDVWATGYSVSGTTSSTLVEHWNGSTWALTPSPSPGSAPFTNPLLGVTALARPNAWALGFYDDAQKTLVEHWDGSRWVLTPSPS